jgi:hypothetical protein
MPENQKKTWSQTSEDVSWLKYCHRMNELPRPQGAWEELNELQAAAAAAGAAPQLWRFQGDESLAEYELAGAAAAAPPEKEESCLLSFTHERSSQEVIARISF